ncbi:MAG: hypothetical protein VB934_10980, partial [Polyangiaceae bacterium]
PPGFGRMKLDGTLKKKFGQSLTEEPVDYYQTLPDIFRLGFKSRIKPNMELRLFADYQRWSLVDYQCVSKDNEDCVVKLTESRGDGDPKKGAGLDNAGAPNSAVTIGTIREWNDSFGIRAGASYWLKPSIELFAGAGYDSNAVPDSSIDPVLFDMHDISLGLGGRFELTDYLHGAISYTQIFYISRDTPAGSSANPTYSGPSKWPDASGRYEHAIGVLNINFEASFDVFGKKNDTEEPALGVDLAPEPGIDPLQPEPAPEAAPAPAPEAPPAPEEAPPAPGGEVEAKPEPNAKADAAPAAPPTKGDAPKTEPAPKKAP